MYRHYLDASNLCGGVFQQCLSNQFPKNKQYYLCITNIFLLHIKYSYINITHILLLLIHCYYLNVSNLGDGAFRQGLSNQFQKIVRATTYSKVVALGSYVPERESGQKNNEFSHIYIYIYMHIHIHIYINI